MARDRVPGTSLSVDHRCHPYAAGLGCTRPRAWRIWLLGALLGLCSTAQGEDAFTLDVAQERSLQASQSLQLALGLSESGPVRVVVEERGIDVEVSLIAAEQRWSSNDGDILRWGRHQLALANATPGLQLQVRVKRAGSPPGKVGILVQRVDLGSPAVSRHFALELSETELAQRMADPVRLLEAATANLGNALCDAWREADDLSAALRCGLLLDRVLAAQSRRPEAIAVLQRDLPGWRRLRDARGEASALNNIGMHHYRLGDGRLAGPPLEQALTALHGVDDDLLRAVVQNNLCLTQNLRVSIEQARLCYERVLALSEASGDGARIATALNNLGGAYFLLGDGDKAAQLFERAIARWEALGTSATPGDPLHNLGLVRQSQGRLSEALQWFERAHAAQQRANNLSGQARALRQRGQIQLLLGDPTRAVELMQQALTTQRQLGRRDDIVATLSRLAEVQLATGQAAQALAATQEAIAAAAIDADPHLIADTFLRAARIHLRRGDAPAARASAQQALAAATSLDDAVLVAQARLEGARAELQLQQPARARALATRAAASLRGEVLAQIDVSRVLAEAARAQGQSAIAETEFRRAIAAADRAGAYVFDPERRATFLAAQREVYLGLISLLMETPGDGAPPAGAAAALQVSESFRARNLRDRLATAPRAATADEDDARDQLLGQLAALAMARWKVQDEHAGEARARQIQSQIRDVEDRLSALDGAAPATPTPATAPVFDLAQLQRNLPADASLVVYRNTPEALFAWVVRRDALHAARLAAPAEVEAVVERVRQRLGVGSEGAAAPAQWRAALREACAMVWSPLAQWVQGERVFVVSDGALDRLPFAALRCDAATPDSEDPAGYLVHAHEFSRLPATWLLSRPAPEIAAAELSALLVSDPIYSAEDPRVQPQDAVATTTASSDTALRRGAVARLRGSAEEVRLVRERLGEQHSVLLEGAEATLANLRKHALDRYQILHFATHGSGDPDGVAGSGLILSLVDDHGKAIDGFLSARQVARWRLTAALVVLGACDTATGRQISGEGTVSVAYSFLFAGARHVAAALWPIDDGVMPWLMRGFYQEPRVTALRPAFALRRAQQALLQEYPQASPALWAALEVIGQ